MTDAEFIPCTPMSLPAELEAAGVIASEKENPQNRMAGLMASVIDPGHLAVSRAKYWSNKGVRLTVGFMESISVELRNKILAHMNIWDKYCNVEFTYSNTNPQVRITREGHGYWSYVGTDILQIPVNQPTMCLQGFTLNTPQREWDRVVPHEAGHTAGFQHEHARREIVNRLDIQKTIAYFRQTQGWSASMVQQQVLTPLEEQSIFGTTSPDETSIMTYSFPGSITRDGRPIIGGLTLSEADKRFSAELYPDAVIQKPEPPVGGKRLVEYILDLDKQTATVLMPSGWTLTPRRNSEGDIPMDECDRSPSQLLPLAAELEALMPAGTNVPENAAALPIGGLVSKVWELIAAMKASDWTATIKAVRDLLNLILGEDGGSIGFQTAEAAKLNIDWVKLIGLIMSVFKIVSGG